MEEQFNLDLEPMSEERTSTFSDGQSQQLGTPTRSPLFEDEDGYAFADFYENGQVVIHSHLKVDPTPMVLKKASAVSEMIGEAFKEKGYTELYTWGYTDAHERYNVFLQYFPTGNEVNIEGWDGPTMFEYKKVLN